MASCKQLLDRVEITKGASLPDASEVQVSKDPFTSEESKTAKGGPA